MTVASNLTALPRLRVKESERNATNSTFASWSIRNFRIYAMGAFASNIGTWIGRVTQDWIVLTQLTDHDAVALGVVTALQFAPVVLLAPFAGSLADSYPKRKLLVLTQGGLAATSLALAVLLLTGTATLGAVFVTAFLQGVITALDNPTRQAFVSEMVPSDNLTNAVALNSASFNAARLIGPGLAGLLLAAVGAGWSMLLNGLSFIAVICALLAMNTSALTPAPRRHGRGGVREGFAYVKSRRDLQLIMSLIFVLGTFGMNFQITTALMATQIFHADARAYGLISSVMAVGSLGAALLAARRKVPSFRLLIFALAAFTVFSALAALAPNIWLFGLFLVPVGLAALTAMTTANAAVQISVDPQLRGRVMALYMAVFLGGTPLGAPLIGWVGNTFGPRWTILVGTIAVGAATVLAGAALMRVRHYTARNVLDMRPHRHTADGQEPKSTARAGSVRSTKAAVRESAA